MKFALVSLTTGSEGDDPTAPVMCQSWIISPAAVDTFREQMTHLFGAPTESVGSAAGVAETTRLAAEHGLVFIDPGLT